MIIHVPTYLLLIACVLMYYGYILRILCCSYYQLFHVRKSRVIKYRLRNGIKETKNTHYNTTVRVRPMHLPLEKNRI